MGSSDQRNTIWHTAELEGDRDIKHGASGLVYGRTSGTVVAMEAAAVVERDPPDTRQARRID